MPHINVVLSSTNLATPKGTGNRIKEETA